MDNERHNVYKNIKSDSPAINTEYLTEILHFKDNEMINEAKILIRILLR